MERFVSGLVFPGQVEFPEGLKREVERVATSLTEKFLTTPFVNGANWTRPHLRDAVMLLAEVNGWLSQLPHDQKPVIRQEWMGWEVILKGNLPVEKMDEFVFAVVEMGVAMGSWEVLSGMQLDKTAFPINMEEEIGLHLAEIVVRMMVAVRMSEAKEGQKHWLKLVEEIVQHSQRLRQLTHELAQLVFRAHEPRCNSAGCVREERATLRGLEINLSEWGLTLNRVWLGMVQATIASQGLQAGLRVLYDRMDNAMLDGKAEEVAQLLQTIYQSEVSLEILMGALTITCGWRNELPNRHLVAEKAKAMAKELFGESRAEGILKGLVA